jgi:hypothetical protein
MPVMAQPPAGCTFASGDEFGAGDDNVVFPGQEDLMNIGLSDRLILHSRFWHIAITGLEYSFDILNVEDI